MSLKYPCVYVFLYKKVKEKARGTNLITHNDLLEILKRMQSKLPNVLKYIIIKELIELKLIKKINKRKYKIIGGNKDKLLLKYNYPI